jgi:hypothetical protein
MRSPQLAPTALNRLKQSRANPYERRHTKNNKPERDSNNGTDHQAKAGAHE